MRITIVALAAASALGSQLGCHSGKSQVDHPQADGDADAAAVACEKSFALECSDGLVDGCTRKLTAYHICMPADEQAAQPCAQEVARTCAEGLVDACQVSPPAADTHVCVAASGPPADEPSPPSDPAAPDSPPDTDTGADAPGGAG